jgi:Protein of unknown function (DUF1566)
MSNLRLILLLATGLLPFATARAAPADLPQTGQTACTDAAGATIACANTGQDGDRRAGVAWPNPRFTADGTGNCITDNLTGLMWVRNPDATTRTWQQALEFTTGLAQCGSSDWRLPNVNELESLVNIGTANQATFLNGQGFSGVQAANYWSSSIWAGFGSGSVPLAWVVTMAGGGLGPIPRSASGFVLPVRAGQ